MPRQLRIETVVTLPDDIVSASKAIAHADERLTAIAREFPEGAVTWSFVTTKPRTAADTTHVDA
jgi:hypothetical protein